MSAGRLIAVVGPSGVGKDSVLAALHHMHPDRHLVRRVITRTAASGGEEFDAVSETQFAAMAAEGAFALHWRAHGLRYGIPVSVFDHLSSGTDCLVNLSRAVLAEAASLFPDLTILNITARPETLARRLAARGRETESQIAQRLERADAPLDEGLPVIHLSNDGDLSQTVAQAERALAQPDRSTALHAPHTTGCLT